MDPNQPKLNVAEHRLLTRLGPLIPDAIGKAIKLLLEKTDVRLSVLEAECVSLRKALSNASGSGVRRRFTSCCDDPENPGCSLLFLDDGSAISLPDVRLNSLAATRIEGNA